MSQLCGQQICQLEIVAAFEYKKQMNCMLRNCFENSGMGVALILRNFICLSLHFVRGKGDLSYFGSKSSLTAHLVKGIRHS